MNEKKLLAITIICGVVLVSGGCPGKVPKHSLREGVKITDYFPLRIGNKWTYVNRFRGLEERKAITIISKEGKFYIDDAGGKYFDDGEGLRDKKRYLIKYPLKKGTKWLSIVSEASVERYEIVDLDIKVKVPAGIFSECMLVEATNRVNAETRMIGRFYYAKGVGLVKMETSIELKDKEPIPQTVIELVDYKIVNP